MAYLDIEWEETGEDDDLAGRLSPATWDSLNINGVQMHVEAYAVSRNESGWIEADTDWGESALDAIYMIDEGDGNLTTFTHDNDREYVLVAYPFFD
jgi:hypothetical protein